MNRFVKVLLWAMVLGSGSAGLWLSGATAVAADEPKERATLKGHTSWVLSVVISPDGKTLASASFDQTIKLWDLAVLTALSDRNLGRMLPNRHPIAGCLLHREFRARLPRLSYLPRVFTPHPAHPIFYRTPPLLPASSPRC